MRCLGKHIAVWGSCTSSQVLAEQQKRRTGCEVDHICEKNMMV